jgi:hypothetical protein
MLKPDRQPVVWDIRHYMNETADQGSFPVQYTASSGADLDGADNVASIEANPSGYAPLGVLVDEVVDLDLTKYPVNWHKEQTNVGYKVSIIRKGLVATDQIDADFPAVAGGIAVLRASGLIGSVDDLDNYVPSANPTIGRFETTEDEDGFAFVFVDV